MKFYDTASFGKRVEFTIIAKMLKEGLDIYRPMVDDKQIDCILRRDDGTFAELQIKGRSKNTDKTRAALFSAIKCIPNINYWFIFYSEGVGDNGTIWIMNSLEFVKLASKNKRGKNIDKYSILFNSTKIDELGNKIAYPRSLFVKYIAQDFSRIINNNVVI